MATDPEADEGNDGHRELRDALHAALSLTDALNIPLIAAHLQFTIDLLNDMSDPVSPS